MRRILILSFAALLAGTTAAYAQGLGSIVGTVVDPTGAAVPSAQVTVTEARTGFSRATVSGPQGYYVLPSLRPSQYNLNVEAKGFRASTTTGITLLADQTLTVNVTLQIGTATESITVTSENVAVDVTTATLKHVVEGERILELPLEGRNAAQLTLAAPGAQSSPDGGADQGTTKTFPGAVTISANGSRQNQISYQLDGGNHVDEYTNVNQPFPFPDALQEFSVQTSNYSAAYGQNAGAVVNVVTKHGTNEVHGNVFEFVRNAVFNAKDYFSTTGRDKLKRNQFGGVIGGPVVLPFYNGRERTFFFAGYQGTLLRNVGDTTNRVVPTAAQRAAALDPAVITLLKFIPVGDGLGNATFVRPDRQDFHEVISRIDHSFNTNDRLMFREDYNRFKRAPVYEPANILSYRDGSTIVNQNYLFHETHIFSPHLLNDARFGFSREEATRGPASGVPNVRDFGVKIPFQPAVKAIQSIRVGGGFSFGDNPPAAFVRNNFTWSDDVSQVIGQHNLHYGGVLERSRVDLNNLFFQPGEFTFSSMADFIIGKLGKSGSNPGFRQGAGEFKNNRNIFAGLYFQDDWHMSRRLTLNAGIRWEPFFPWREIKDRAELFRVADAHPGGPTSSVYINAPAGLFFPGDVGVPKDGVRGTLKNFAPRLGFAYDVFGTGKTSIRGGAGMFYDTRQVGIVNNRVVDDPPFSPQLILATPPGPFSDPLMSGAVASPFPASFPPPKDAAFPTPVLIHTYDPSGTFQVPAVYGWNLTVEQQMPRGFLVRAGYVGSHSSHIKESMNLNPALPSTTKFDDSRRRLNTAFGATVVGGVCVNCVYSDVWMDKQDVNSSYHSAQLSVERRVASGLTLAASYTWSKSIDDLPESGSVADFGTGDASALPWDDPNRHAFDRGLSDFDHTHRFTVSYVWQMPTFSNNNAWLRRFLGNWTFSGVGQAQSGRPFTATSGGKDLSGTGIGHDRAQLVAGQSLFGSGACAAAKITTPCVDYLNVNAFAQPALGSFGNASKNGLRGPGLFSWNMGLFKNIPFNEHLRAQFRAEFFNVFNRANFSNPTNGRNSSRFGTITSGSDPRIGQLALKIIF